MGAALRAVLRAAMVAALRSAMVSATALCFLRAPHPPSSVRPSGFPSIYPSTHLSACPSISAHMDIALAAVLNIAVALAWLLHASPRSCFDPANLRRRRRVKAVRTKLARVAAMTRVLLESLEQVDKFVEPLLDAWRCVMEHQSADEILRTVVSDLAEDVGLL